MNIIVLVVLIYLVAGIGVLLLFDLLTKRIRNRLLVATAETQQRMGEAGAPMSSSSARILFIGLMWLFWPAVIIGAATDSKEKKE